MPTYPIGQNATTARDGEVNVANVVKGHVNGSNVSDEAIIVPSGAVDLPTTADATNPASGSTRLVARSGGLYVRTSGGAESGPLGGAVAPLAHAASHQDGGSDELALDGSQITSGTVAAARLGSGTASAGTVVDHGDGTGTRTLYGPDGNVTATEQVTGLPVEPVEAKTERSLHDRLRQALDNNRTYLALPAPTAAQQRKHTERLTRQTNALIRQVLGLLDTDDTGD